ncbi:MAG: tRNA 2-thiouridine(34) synthase MnmA [Candidatus Falkowbacteria bacterium]
MKKSKGKVLMAMSGGVDSSVAAQLLKDQGYDVVGIFLHFWKDETAPENVAENKCCSLQALLDAKTVAQKVGVPLHTFNFSDPFKREVVDYFLEDYKCGKTPNPCVMCNRKIKIGRLLEYAKGLGFDYVATGHYLNVKRVGKKTKVYKAKDKNKDQSYFLYTFTPEQWSHLMFPLGNYTKPQVRVMAKKFKLPVAEKSDSQEICFIPGKHHNDFLKRYLKMKAGDIKLIDEDNKIIGRHQGLPLYTIGQRRGVEIGGDGPYYVAKFDWKKNDLYVVRKFDDPVFFGQELVASDVNWISGQEPKMPFKCEAVIRYRHAAVKCTVTKNSTGNYAVQFAAPQRAITPGQSIVFYKGEEMLGGGIIA